jgi:hypothetical protein
MDREHLNRLGLDAIGLVDDLAKRSITDLGDHTARSRK